MPIVCSHWHVKLFYCTLIDHHNCLTVCPLCPFVFPLCTCGNDYLIDGCQLFLWLSFTFTNLTIKWAISTFVRQREQVSHRSLNFGGSFKCVASSVVQPCQCPVAAVSCSVHSSQQNWPRMSLCESADYSWSTFFSPIFYFVCVFLLFEVLLSLHWHSLQFWRLLLLRNLAC